MATTPGKLISQASATWAGLASASAATSRSVWSSGSMRRRFSVPNKEFTARTPPGRLFRPYLPPNSPCASGLYAITMRFSRSANGTRSSSAPGRASEKSTWLLMTGRPRAASARCHRSSE
ncbi:Uncharacterised protein [Mycobacterium tuberculosis]|nr:Uncharacterised protein [Mycobacterium tuberculosis]